jgi:hypothetical protein
MHREPSRQARVRCLHRTVAVAAVAGALLTPAVAPASTSRPYPANAYSIAVKGTGKFYRTVSYRQSPSGDNIGSATDENTMAGSYRFFQHYHDIFIPRQRSRYTSFNIPAVETSLSGEAKSNGHWTMTARNGASKSGSYTCSAPVRLTPGFGAALSYQPRKRAYRVFFEPAQSLTSTGPQRHCNGDGGDASVVFDLFGGSMASAKDDGSPMFTFDSLGLTQRAMSKRKVKRKLSAESDANEASRPNNGSTSFYCAGSSNYDAGSGTLNCKWHQEWKATVVLTRVCSSTRGTKVRFKSGFTDAEGDEVYAPIGRCRR